MKNFPPISIIIVTLNSQRTIKECLGHIQKQNYPNVSEVLIVDGGSSDKTLDIVRMSKLQVKVIEGSYRNNQEARRAVGIENAKNEICAFIDSDNFMLDMNWLKQMVQPLLIDKEIIATQTLRYAVPKNASALNRYFGLIGGADPVSYYLGRNDRLSWAFSRWNLLGKVILENKNYIKIEFEPNNYPTVGCNGVLFRKSFLQKSNWGKPENYLHTDVFVDIGKLGYNKFGIVKNEIFHNTAGNPISFLLKRRKYMQIYHQKMNKKRRQLVFNSNNINDVLKLTLFVIYFSTILEPLIESIIGYVKKRDIAWFLHPVICFGMGLIYIEATLRMYAGKLFINLND
jgi:glycosyltransferase involved in cell wall biosynthesis